MFPLYSPEESESGNIKYIKNPVSLVCSTNNHVSAGTGWSKMLEIKRFHSFSNLDGPFTHSMCDFGLFSNAKELRKQLVSKMDSISELRLFP